MSPFRDTLQTLGWIEGRNLRIELRWGAGDAGKIEAFAKELVNLQPDAILAQTTPAAVGLAHETKTIPIVFVTVSDPIGSGLATSLTHPAGNVTGFTFVESSMGGKWVELLKEIAPRTVRMALLFNPATAPPLQFYTPSIQAAALSFAVEVSAAPVRNRNEIGKYALSGQLSKNRKGPRICSWSVQATKIGQFERSAGLLGGPAIAIYARAST